MTVDGLSFLGTSRFGYRREPAELLAALSAEGIDTALVAPMHRATATWPRPTPNWRRSSASIPAG